MSATDVIFNEQLGREEKNRIIKMIMCYSSQSRIMLLMQVSTE